MYIGQVGIYRLIVKGGHASLVPRPLPPFNVTRRGGSGLGTRLGSCMKQQNSYMYLTVTVVHMTMYILCITMTQITAIVHV